MTPTIVRVWRGGAVESIHRGAIAVADTQGRVVASVGDPGLRSFARSAIKPLQALPLVADGAYERFGLSLSELAVISGSHGGEDFHLAAVRSILRKADLEEESLRCGVSYPLHEPSAWAMRARGEPPRALTDNCSGKHAGMLALARHHGWSTGDYLLPDHPVQRRIREVLAACAGSQAAVATSAVDGCGAPTYHVSLAELGTAFARLVTPASLPEPLGGAATSIVQAMTHFPEMVAGTDRLDTVLMSTTGPRLVAKSGGEAIFAVGLAAQGLGMALKIEDGGPRAVRAAVIEALRQVGALNETETAALAALHHPPVLNRRGETVGEMRADFALEGR